MERHVVAREGELPPGTRKIVNLNGRSIGVFNVEGRFYAVRNACPHYGGPLGLGRVAGTMLPSEPHTYVYGLRKRVLRCPWHGFEFDLETGLAIYDPTDLRVKVYEVTLEDGEVVVHA